MQIRYIILLFLLALIGGCTSTLKLPLKKIGGVNDAIDNAIVDYANRNSNHKKGVVYNVDYKYITKDLIGVSILEYSDEKVFITKKDSIGSNVPYFPTRIKEMQNQLYYWYDSSSVVTESLIQKLIEYDQIDSSRYHKPEIIEFSYNDNKKATHYYFCTENLTKYARKESNIALGYGKVPKIKCN